MSLMTSFRELRADDGVWEGNEVFLLESSLGKAIECLGRLVWQNTKICSGRKDRDLHEKVQKGT